MRDKVSALTNCQAVFGFATGAIVGRLGLDTTV